MPGAFPDAPARERFPAPRHRSGLRKTTGQETAQAETLETPNSRPLAGTPETQLLGGQFPWKQVQRLAEGCLFFT